MIDNVTDIFDQIRDEFNYQIDNFNVDDIVRLAELIKNTSNNIHFCGVGKSGNISKHCCDLLKSISISAFNFDVLNSTHGDIGSLKDGDMLVFFSSSGNTQELINITTNIKNKNIITVCVCCNSESKLADVCDLSILTPLKKEIGGNIDKIPTSSIMSQLLFINILTSMLKSSISLDQYKENHTSGSIGNHLLKIRDLLIAKDFPIVNIEQNGVVDIHDVMLQMTEYKIGCCYFVDSNNNLLGILTGGDCRRLLLKKKHVITINDINDKFYYESDVSLFLPEIKKLHVKYIPVLDNLKLIGIIDTADVVKCIS